MVAFQFLNSYFDRWIGKLFNLSVSKRKFSNTRLDTSSCQFPRKELIFLFHNIWNTRPIEKLISSLLFHLQFVYNIFWRNLLLTYQYWGEKRSSLHTYVLKMKDTQTDNRINLSFYLAHNCPCRPNLKLCKTIGRGHLSGPTIRHGFSPKLFSNHYRQFGLVLTLAH